ncbi:MAG: hypothetical protein AAGB51_11345 [Planctomycetota bacterium]
MSETAKHVALVGHCGPDSFALRDAIGSAVPGAEIRMVNDEASLRVALPEVGLLLVNRLLDGSFPTQSGIELIRTMIASGTAPPAILVSNFPDAQQEAEEAGALPGFGKRDLYTAETGQRIRAALATEDR